MNSKLPVAPLCLFFLLNLLAFSTQLRGQGVTSSSLGGMVTDASGAPVAGAQITAVDTSSGTTYNSVTRAGGRYDISNVRTGGPYKITARANGMSKSKSGVFTTLSQTLTLICSSAPPAAQNGRAVKQSKGPLMLVAQQRSASSSRARPLRFFTAPIATARAHTSPAKTSTPSRRSTAA